MMTMMTMTTINDVEKIIENYVHSAYAYGNAMENGDYNTANTFFDKNKQAFERLIRFGSRGCRPLYRLLNHQNPHVRISAATHLLATYTEESLAVLEELADDPGFQGLTAKMVLADFKKGDFLVPKLKN
jgi:hypothetical protein